MLQVEQHQNHALNRHLLAIWEGFKAAGHDVIWREVGILTMCEHMDSSFSRLENSLYRGNEDYEGLALQVMGLIVDRDPGNELKLARYALCKLKGPFRGDSPERDQLQNVVHNLEGILVIGGDDLSEHPNIADHSKRIQQAMIDDPEAAIGHSKDLVESALKTFLDLPADEPKKLTIPQMAKAARDKLSKDFGGLEHNKDLLKTLSNFGQILDSIAKVRNRYGTGHGRGPEETFDLPQPYVILAANAAIAAAVFLTQMHDLKTAEPEDLFAVEDSQRDLEEGEDLPW